MGKDDTRETDVNFILTPDPQGFARLLPLLESLALSVPTDEDEHDDIEDGTENSDSAHD